MKKNLKGNGENLIDLPTGFSKNGSESVCSYFLVSL